MPYGPGPRKTLSGLSDQHGRSAQLRPSARATLRAATNDAHERMHAHAGYSALASGTIEAEQYRRLLARSYGFYLPVEVQLLRGRDRSRRLEADLMALGMVAESIAALPLCVLRSPLDSHPKAQGAAYVVEGAALGGLAMARALMRNSGVVEPPVAFLLGDAENSGRRWQTFIAELEADLSDMVGLETAVRSARDTFETFETWMAAWDR